MKAKSSANSALVHFLDKSQHASAHGRLKLRSVGAAASAQQHKSRDVLRSQNQAERDMFERVLNW